VLETEKRRKEKRCKRLGLVQPRLCSVWHTGLSGGAPDSVRCARLNSGEQAALGKIWWRTTIIHRTVRWCTGLSGEPTAASATVGRAIRGRRVARANGRQGAPDYPVCTRQCPVHQLPRRCNGHLCQIRKEIRTGHATVTVRCTTR
jgi:predicted ArsR family transcriptional regulator